MISEYHAAAIAEIEQARLVAVSSRDEENRARLMDQYACEGTADYNELIRRKDIDVVCVCTPSGAHLEPTQAAARAGKHVVVEKPMEVTLKRVDAVIRACDKNGVRLCAVFPSRFGAAALILKDAIDTGRFGRITVGDCYNKWWRTQEYYDSGGWRGTRELDGGGACMNQGIHAIDLIQWFMGPVAAVAAFTACLAHERIEVEDTAVAVLHYESGAMGVIECTTSVHPGLSRRIEIHGDKGTAVMQDEAFVQWDFAEELPADEEIRKKHGVGTGLQRAGAADPRAISHVGHRKQIEDMLSSLDTGAEPLVDGREGRKAIEIIQAIYKSSKTGQIVKLPLRTAK